MTANLSLRLLAADAAGTVVHRVPHEVRHFDMGIEHHVFEALFEDRAPVVIRIGEPTQRAGMADGVRLNAQLRSLDVPLPAILATGLDEPLPWVAMERLPGTDLGRAMSALPARQWRAVAEKVAGAQAAAARVGSAGRYGYAASPEAAPHATWSRVLDASLHRSGERIRSAGFFGPGPVERVAALIAPRRDELDAVPARAFLHDTTTKNVIVSSSGTLSGIVDVDDLCFGDPRYVPALTLAVLLAFGGPTGYVEHWMSVAGQHADALFRLYVAMFVLDLMSEQGQRFNGNERPSTSLARAALLTVFDEACLRAEAG